MVELVVVEDEVLASLDFFEVLVSFIPQLDEGLIKLIEV